MLLADDYGWGNMGIHRRKPLDALESQGALEVHTPNLDSLIDEGILLDRHYVYKICSPSRSSLQSGRLAVHVNTANIGPLAINPKDPVSGYAGIPRNMTGMAQKMRSAGYRTHMVGKWDAGMATPEQTPYGKGYETWTGYYQHANDYWRKSEKFTATGEFDQCFNRMLDFATLNATYRGGVRDALSLTDACKNHHEMDPACYEEHIFKARALEIINSHNTSNVDSPLFLLYAPHLVHAPLEVPAAYRQRIQHLVTSRGGKKIDTLNRLIYAAMVLYLDDAIGEVVQALKAKYMWEDTLVVFTSDNGGPIYEPGGANNYPLKGGKFNDWEGGVRSNAFVAGGVIPKGKRGTTFSGVISIADWYGTFCEIAGVSFEDTAAQAANVWLKANKLPTLAPVDSVPQWGFIMNGTNGRQKPLHLSEAAVLRWPYKLVVGKQEYSVWTGPLYPNCSTVDSIKHERGPDFDDLKFFNNKMLPSAQQNETELRTWTQDCRSGCLVNVEKDPTEHHDLAKDPSYAYILRELQVTLNELNKDLFRPDRGTSSAEGCKIADRMGGYLGPFVHATDFYRPMPHLSIKERIKNLGLGLLYDLVNVPGIKSTLQGAATRGWPHVGKRVDRILDKCLVNKTSSDHLGILNFFI